MRENRTQLGNITYGILTAMMSLFAINCLLVIVQVLLTASMTRIPLGTIFMGLLMVLGVLALAFWIYYRYWKAFRYNVPLMIKGVTKFMLILSAIGFVVMGISVSFLSKHGYQKSEYSNAIILSTLWLICFTILKIELKAYENGRISSGVWIVVAAIALILFISALVNKSSDLTTLSGITGLLVNLCFDTGITLISYWVTNQDKFYIPETKEEYHRVEEIPAIETDMPNITDDYSSQLRELKELLDDGIITEEDYEIKKKEILGI